MIGINTVHFSMTTLNAGCVSELTPAGSGLPYCGHVWLCDKLDKSARIGKRMHCSEDEIYLIQPFWLRINLRVEA